MKCSCSFFLIIVLLSVFNFVIGSSKKPISFIKKHDLTKTKMNKKVVVEAAASKVSSAATTTSSLSTSSFNLAKCIGGAGVLSLPAGVALFSDSPSAIIPSCIIALIMGLMSGYTFSAIGKGCERYQDNNYQNLWGHAISEKSKIFVTMTLLSKTCLATLALTIILGDTFKSLASSFGAPEFLQSRTNVIFTLATTILLPLCSLKSLAALAPFSILGLIGMLYTGVFMTIRYMDGSYTEGGKFFESISENLRPVFNSRPNPVNKLTFVLLSMLSTAYIAHYNAPTFYKELENNTMDRFNVVISWGFGASILLFMWIMSMGFLTFGGNSQGLILNNYSLSDTLASGARISIGLALITGYPFIFSAFRDGILDFMNVPTEKREKTFIPATITLLGVLAILASILTDVGFVVSFAGALFGSTLMFTIPATVDAATATGSRLLLDRFIQMSGVSLMVLGVTISVLKQMGKL